MEESARVTALMLPGIGSNVMLVAAGNAAQLQSGNASDGRLNIGWSEDQTAQADNASRSQYDRSRMLPCPPQQNDTMYHHAQYNYGPSSTVLPHTATATTYPPISTNTNFDHRSSSSGFTPLHGTATPIIYPPMTTNTNTNSHHRSISSGFTSSGTLPAAIYSSGFVPNGNNVFFPSPSPAYDYGPAPVQPGSQVCLPPS